MITLASFLHRQDLRRLVARWLADDFHPGDPSRIKELVNFNSLAVRLALERFVAELLPAVYGRPLVPTPLRTKGELRDFLVRTAVTMRQEHEEHVIRQRGHKGPHEGVTRNIAALTQFLFYFALSRRTRLDGIPIKLGTRYMPDRLEQVLLSLTDFPAGELGLIP